MARAQRSTLFVFVDPETFGPIGGTFAPDTTSFAALSAGGWLPKIRALANFLRGGLLNAKLAGTTAVGGPAAQNGNAPYVKALPATGGQLATALAAFSGAYVQAEWVALFTLMGQVQTAFKNAGLSTATASVTPYTLPRKGRSVIRDFRIGGTEAPAMTSPGAAYTKTEIDKIVASMEFCRHLAIWCGLATDRVGVDAVSVINDGGSTEQFFLNADINNAASMAPILVDMPAANLVDSNGTTQTGTTVAYSSDLSVATITRVDAVNYTITPVGAGRCSLWFGVAGKPKLREIVLTIGNSVVPASIVLTVADAAMNTVTDQTEQPTWVVKNAAGFAIDIYTNLNPGNLLLFASTVPAKATINATTGLITTVAAGTTNVSVTFTKTFTDQPFNQLVPVVITSNAVTITVT